jgi:glutamate-5-semialdehyde dehydrogenase
VIAEPIQDGFKALRRAARATRALSSAAKNAALADLAERLPRESARVLRANATDLQAFDVKHQGGRAAFRDRLRLDEARIAAMAESLRQIAALPDPVGEVVETARLRNGLLLRRQRAPLGVLFMIFESRPNIITEVFGLALKSGNVIALRGGSESRATAQVLYDLIGASMAAVGVPTQAFLGIQDYDRTLVPQLLKRSDWIDVVIPRGGDELISLVSREALMPVIKNDRGMCHAYVDADCDLNMAVAVVANAKTQRPGVCNSLETVLVHSAIAGVFLPALHAACVGVGLSWRCDEESFALLGSREKVFRASPGDWNTEHLDQILNCRIVDGMDQALEHIEAHGSRHSETILTKDPTSARRFQAEVDSAVVYWNASTRFTDGYEFGLGGELGISTQKLHVRGPVGLRELTTPRWLVDGQGQVRGG